MGIFTALPVVMVALCSSAVEPVQKLTNSPVPPAPPVRAEVQKGPAVGEKATATPKITNRVENLAKNWNAMTTHGKWVVIGDTEVQQTVDEIQVMYAGNTGFGRAIDQSGVMEYAWSINPASLKHGCGFFVMATDGDKEERGNGYLLWLTKTPTASFAIMKMTGNQPPVEQVKFPVVAFEGAFNELKARYDTGKGDWTLTCNGKVAGKWKDPQPNRKGGFVSFTTCFTKAVIKNVSITKVE